MQGYAPDMRQAVLYGLIVFCVILAGCTSSMDVGTMFPLGDTSFSNLRSASDNATYHLSYRIETGDELAGVEETTSFDEYRFNGEKKVVTVKEGRYRDSIQARFEHGGQTVTCVEHQSYRGSRVECSTGDTYGFIDPRKQVLTGINTSSLSSQGVRTIADRRCTAFIGKAAANITESGERLNTRFCLDNEYGYVAAMTVNKTVEPALRSSYETTLYRMNVTDFDTEVTRDDVTVPIAYTADLSCDDSPSMNGPHLTFTPFQEFNTITLNVSGTNVTKHVGPRFREAIIPLDRLLFEDGSNTVTIYGNGHKITEYCYYDRYDYHTSSGYRFESSDACPPYEYVSAVFNSSRLETSVRFDYDDSYTSPADSPNVTLDVVRNRQVIRNTTFSVDAGGAYSKLLDGFTAAPDSVRIDVQGCDSHLLVEEVESGSLYTYRRECLKDNWCNGRSTTGGWRCNQDGWFNSSGTYWCSCTRECTVNAADYDTYWDR